MRMKNIILVTLLALLAGFASCTKDHEIPTGKIFNKESGGGNSQGSYTIGVSANPSNGGTVSGGGAYADGQSCTLTATSNAGYTFSNWTENGNVASTNANYTFVVTGNRTLVANFIELQPNEYAINVSANPSEGGTVSGGGTYQQGQSCVVTATANSGYTLVNWTENGAQVSLEASYIFPVISNRTLVANFTGLQPDEYTISVSANPTEGGTVSGGGTYQQGQSCIVSATANTGHAFISWTENGNVVSTDTNYTFNVTSDRMLVANFDAVPQISFDTLTVMQYDLLEYGNYNSGFADCYETNNNTQRKDECIRTLIEYVKPDIFTVCDFGATAALQNDFLSHNLNINGANYWQSDDILNYAGSNIINHIFFDSRKLGLRRHVALRTNPRDTDVYELYLKTSSLAIGDTIKLICIVAHLKAGQTYEANRRAAIQTAMDYFNQHYPNNNALIMGNFNMYSASESGYLLLTETNNLVDPIAGAGGVGEWNNNSQFAAFHTQSTRSYSDECFSSGGLDDRFDFILMSDEIASGYKRLSYVQSSYKTIGNDGDHFNLGINENTNTSVPSVVLDALYDCSDHLPVTMKIVVEH